MFGYVLENTLENIFYTCCSQFLTFFRLPNEYILSFISQNTNKTPKKIIKSEQTKARSRSTSIGAVSGSFSLSVAAFVHLLCFVVFWLSVFLSFASATEIV